MEIQNVKTQAKDGKLSVTWELVVADARAITIAVGNDSEIVGKCRYFTIPPISGNVCLDVGPGSWFVRLGAWIGKPEGGKIAWSGIYGPAVISAMRVISPVQESVFRVNHTQSMHQGYRIFTGRTAPAYAIIDYGTSAKFAASKTRTQYAWDLGKGHFDCVGLDSNTTYSLRISGFTTEQAKLPDSAVKPAAAFLAFHGRRATPVRAMDGGSRALQAADMARLRDTTHTTYVRYASHEDYVRSRAAEAKLKDSGSGR